MGVVGHFAGQRNRGAHNAAAAQGKGHTRLDLDPTELAGDSLEHPEEAVGLERATHNGGRVDRQRLKLPEQEEPERLIKISGGKNYALDGGVSIAEPALRMKLGVGFDLESQVGAGVQEKPLTVVTPHRCLQLETRRQDLRVLAAKRADFARTVPLGNAATGSCPQQPEIQHPLDFRGGVAVNLASEANFFQFRAGPDLFHGSLLFQAGCSFLQIIIRLGRLRGYFDVGFAANPWFFRRDPWELL